MGPLRASFVAGSVALIAYLTNVLTSIVKEHPNREIDHLCLLPSILTSDRSICRKTCHARRDGSSQQHGLCRLVFENHGGVYKAVRSGSTA